MYVCSLHSFIFEATKSRGVLKEWKSSAGPTHVVLNVFTATAFSVFKKNVKNGTFARKRNGATSLKLGMQTQLDSSNNMGWVHLATLLPLGV